MSALSEFHLASMHIPIGLSKVPQDKRFSEVLGLIVKKQWLDKDGESRGLDKLAETVRVSSADMKDYLDGDKYPDGAILQRLFNALSIEDPLDRGFMSSLITGIQVDVRPQIVTSVIEQVEQTESTMDRAYYILDPYWNIAYVSTYFEKSLQLLLGQGPKAGENIFKQVFLRFSWVKSLFQFQGSDLIWSEIAKSQVARMKFLGKDRRHQQKLLEIIDEIAENSDYRYDPDFAKYWNSKSELIVLAPRLELMFFISGQYFQATLDSRSIPTVDGEFELIVYEFGNDLSNYIRSLASANDRKGT